MASATRLTKRSVDAAEPASIRTVVWDAELKGFGLRIEPSGRKSFFVRYRPAGGGRLAPKRFLLIGKHGQITPDEARKHARLVLADVARGADPVLERRSERDAPTIEQIANAFMADHINPRRKPTTIEFYRHALDRYIKPNLGSKIAAKVTRADIARLHHELRDRPHLANRVIDVLGSMYGWAGRVGLVPEGTRPVARIEKFKEESRERFLTLEELSRLGDALRIAETKGVKWSPDPKKKTKHAPKEESRLIRIHPSAAAAIRLLVLTGARLREILNLEWAQVDLERGILWLADSKTGRKPVLLGAAAVRILEELACDGRYVIASDKPDQPRRDLKRPWQLVLHAAGLSEIRIHDLRHTFASVGVSSGLGLPVVGRLLGHTQVRTTQRYAHLADDAARRAADAISGTISAAIGIRPPEQGLLLMEGPR